MFSPIQIKVGVYALAISLVTGIVSFTYFKGRADGWQSCKDEQVRELIEAIAKSQEVQKNDAEEAQKNAEDAAWLRRDLQEIIDGLENKGYECLTAADADRVRQLWKSQPANGARTSPGSR